MLSCIPIPRPQRGDNRPHRSSSIVARQWRTGVDTLPHSEIAAIPAYRLEAERTCSRCCHRCGRPPASHRPARKFTACRVSGSAPPAIPSPTDTGPRLNHHRRMQRTASARAASVSSVVLGRSDAATASVRAHLHPCRARPDGRSELPPSARDRFLCVPGRSDLPAPGCVLCRARPDERSDLSPAGCIRLLCRARLDVRSEPRPPGCVASCAVPGRRYATNVFAWVRSDSVPCPDGGT
jgi:hypothetical protein